VLHNLSQVAQLLLERVNALVPEDGVRGIYHALLLLCKAYAKPHTYLTHAHSTLLQSLSRVNVTTPFFSLFFLF
jgi:hypothetical protein